jgi:hypothetical protein
MINFYIFVNSYLISGALTIAFKPVHFVNTSSPVHASWSLPIPSWQFTFVNVRFAPLPLKSGNALTFEIIADQRKTIGSIQAWLRPCTNIIGNYDLKKWKFDECFHIDVSRQPNGL